MFVEARHALLVAPIERFYWASVSDSVHDGILCQQISCRRSGSQCRVACRCDLKIHRPGRATRAKTSRRVASERVDTLLAAVPPVPNRLEVDSPAGSSQWVPFLACATISIKSSHRVLNFPVCPYNETCCFGHHTYRKLTGNNGALVSHTSWQMWILERAWTITQNRWNF